MPEAENLDKTIPTKLKGDGKASDLAATQRIKTPAKPKRSSRLRWLIASVVGFIVFVGLGALGGMQAGVYERQHEAQMVNAVEAYTQYQLGLDDLQKGNCDIARQRFEYVIQLDPNYPGIVDQLVQSQLCSVGTVVSTVQSAGPTPTPDLRGAEVIFADAQSLLLSQNWDQLLLVLDTLRKNFPDFLPIEVDRMYYLSLRFRGTARILEIGDLEGGIFDLNRAEQIGPLDADAQNLRQLAVWYIVGQSFWELDWQKVVEYFQLVVPAAPNLHDLTFFTAQDRLTTALAFYAQDLRVEADRLAGDKQWCSAEAKLAEAAGYSPHPPEVEPTAVFYTDKCALDGDALP